MALRLAQRPTSGLVAGKAREREAQQWHCDASGGDMGNGMHTMPNHCDPGARSPPRDPWGLRPVAGPFVFLRHAGLPSPTPATTLTCRPSESPASAKDQGGQHHDDAVGSLHNLNGWSHGPPGAALSRLQGTAFGGAPTRYSSCKPRAHGAFKL
jgi:hypothetical protein